MKKFCILSLFVCLISTDFISKVDADIALIDRLREGLNRLLGNLHVDLKNPVVRQFLLVKAFLARRRCPANKIYTTCGGCIINCSERYNPPPCHTSCIKTCVCPKHTFWDGKYCVKASRCPHRRG